MKLNESQKGDICQYLPSLAVHQPVADNLLGLNIVDQHGAHLAATYAWGNILELSTVEASLHLCIQAHSPRAVEGPVHPHQALKVPVRGEDQQSAVP